MFRSGGLNSSNYSDLELMQSINQHHQQHQVGQMSQDGQGAVAGQQGEQSDQQNSRDEQTRQSQQQQQPTDLLNLQYTAKIYTQTQGESSGVYRNNVSVFKKIFFKYTKISFARNKKISKSIEIQKIGPNRLNINIVTDLRK